MGDSFLEQTGRSFFLSAMRRMAKTAATVKEDAYPAHHQEGILLIVEGTGLVHNPNSPLRHIAHKSGMVYRNVVYPGSFWPINYDESVARGVSITANIVGQLVESHPDTPIRLLGYSQGARVVGDVVHNFPEGHDIAATVISDPRNERYKGMEVTLGGRHIAHGVTAAGPRLGRSNYPIRQVVAVGDPICNMPTPWANLLGYFTRHPRYHTMSYMGRPLFDAIAAALPKASSTYWVIH